jgi:putative addiction module component (TIGR02574 family)
MSFTEILENLETLTPEQREIVIQRALELDEPPLTPEQQKLIEERLAAHEADPSSSIPFDETIARVRAQIKR